MIAEHEKENYQKNGEKAAADEKHDSHTYSNPEKNETNHSLHNGLLFGCEMIYYMRPVHGYVTERRGRKKIFLNICGEKRKKVFSFLEK